jgi:Transposase DDE domain
MNILLHLFCHIDDFCKDFFKQLKEKQLPRATSAGIRQRKRSLSESEIMTILVAFHYSGYRTFKDFYLKEVLERWHYIFPGLVSYSRFIEFLPSVVAPLLAYLQSCLGKSNGIQFCDSTPLCVCKNPRISQHKVFKGIAQRGKTSVGWFFGFKLHIIVNSVGELIWFMVTPGNASDSTTLQKHDLSCLIGKLVGDKGYISAALTLHLASFGVALITKLRKNTKQKTALRLLEDALLLRSRGMVESVIDLLKNECQIEHSRHRASTGFLTNLFAALAAYCHLPSKPSIGARLNKIELP